MNYFVGLLAINIIFNWFGIINQLDINGIRGKMTWGTIWGVLARVVLIILNIIAITFLLSVDYSKFLN